MESQNRPDPDEILKLINDDDQLHRSAKLRVFMGMSAGVGKTYAMLKAAHQKLAEGVDVVIGVVETHGRHETAALVAGLERIPLKTVIYRNAGFGELDLDAVLARKPKLVIVDELAHSNVPGSRHEKRYQDVLELLNAGIDVYTALNVQHLESRKDTVESITGIVIRETVPDSILEKATQVELVDIAPSELLKRLREGKVYLGDKAREASEKFFKEDKLTALREIALRITAERVDQDLQKFSSTRSGLPWQTNERLLVAVSHSPSSEKLIRATRRLAYNLEAPWIALHINTGVTLNDQDQAQLVKNLNLARELKAEVITTTDTNLPDALKRVAHRKNVTQVIVGRPTRRWFRDLFEGGSLLDRLVRESEAVDIHVIRHDESTFVPRPWYQGLSLYRTQTGWAKYWNTFWFLFVITFFGGVVENFIGYRAIGFIYLLSVLVVGLFGSIGAVLFAATLSALTWNFGFIPPRFTFVIGQADDVILCVAYFFVALIVGFLTNRIRFHERLMREREERTSLLYQVLQDISESQDKQEFIDKVKARVGRLLKGECGTILTTTDGLLNFQDSSRGGMGLNDKERAVAMWSFQNQKVAGWGTDTLGQSQALYLPLRGTKETLGVFIFKPSQILRKLGPEQEILLYSIIKQLGLSIERHYLNRQVHETQRLQDSENLHQTLLNSISHELRTPLTAILGSVESLQMEGSKDPAIREIADRLGESGDRLNRVIENLLDMSRLNSGVLALKKEWQDPSDLFGVVLKKLAKSLTDHPVRVEVTPGGALIRADFRLFEHAISNLVLNSTQYSPAGTEISLLCAVEGPRCRLIVEDTGPGIPAESVVHLFDKFYRVPGSAPGGTGLGLSIVKSIVELHRGTIRYESNFPQGSRFVIELPVDPQPSLPEELPHE